MSFRLFAVLLAVLSLSSVWAGGTFMGQAALFVLGHYPHLAIDALVRAGSALLLAGLLGLLSWFDWHKDDRESVYHDE